jgi:hypothetical protein
LQQAEEAKTLIFYAPSLFDSKRISWASSSHHLSSLPSRQYQRGIMSSPRVRLWVKTPSTRSTRRSPDNRLDQTDRRYSYYGRQTTRSSTSALVSLQWPHTVLAATQCALNQAVITTRGAPAMAIRGPRPTLQCCPGEEGQPIDVLLIHPLSRPPAVRLVCPILPQPASPPASTRNEGSHQTGQQCMAKLVSKRRFQEGFHKIL